MKDALRLKKLARKTAAADAVMDQRIASFENRVHIEMTKFNKILSGNRKLREEIQHLRHVHDKFNQKLDKLNKILENRRQVQRAMINEGNSAIDAQVEHKTRLDKS